MSEPLPAVLPASTTTTTTTSIDATTGQTIFHTVVADAEAVVAKVEDLFVGSTATVSDATADTFGAVATPTTSIIVKVGQLLSLTGRTPVAYAQLSALAVAAVGSDIDQVLAKLKQLVAYSGTPVDVWDEVVAVAKAV